jgi:hypothetical protein
MVAGMLAWRTAAVWLAVPCAACSLTLGFDDLSAAWSPRSSFQCAAIVPAPRFCDDFDAHEQPFQRWTALQQHNGTTNVDGASFVSPRRSFLAVSSAFAPDAADISADALAVLALDELKDKPVVITLSFELRVEAFDSSSDGFVTLVSLDYDRDDGGHLLGVDLVPASGLMLGVSEVSIPDDDSDVLSTRHGLVAGDALAEATWYHIDFQLDIDEPMGADNRFTLSVDGEPRKTAKLLYPLAGGLPTFALGISDISDTTVNAWRLRYDNFLVQVAEQ